MLFVGDDWAEGHHDIEVEDDADTEEIKETALEEAELAEWDDDPPEVVSIAIIEPS